MDGSHTNSGGPQLAILAVGAHPRDVTHMAGTLAHHVQRGDRVTVVSLTGGIRMHREKLYDELQKPPGRRDLSTVRQSDAEYGNEKEREMRKAYGLFGITDVRVFPFPDNPFTVVPEVVQALTEVVLELRPQLVLTHPPFPPQRHRFFDLSSSDHAQAGAAVTHALRVAELPDSSGKRAPHQVAALYYMGFGYPVEDADLLIDVSDQAENRVKAEEIFTTQAITPEQARKSIETDAGAYGRMYRMAYAEAWIRSRPELGRLLTVTDYDLQSAEMPQQERTARGSRMVATEE